MQTAPSGHFFNVMTLQLAGVGDCDTIIDGFRAMEAEQRTLVEAAESCTVAEMHSDLADFAAGQASLAEEICED